MPWNEKAVPGDVLWSLDYAVKFSRSGWKQDRSPVAPIFESPLGFSCSLQQAPDSNL